MKNRQNARKLLNLGCGPFVGATSWSDYDGSWNLLASHLPVGIGRLLRWFFGHKGLVFPGHVKYLNVTKRLPFEDNVVDAIYLSHVLEHLYLDEGKALLAECFRILKAGGVIRVLMPDTEHIAREFILKSQRLDISACLDFNEQLGYRRSSRIRNILGRWYEASTDFHSHKFMYDRVYLKYCLQKAGFASIEEANYNVSRIPEINEVEVKTRIGDGSGFGIEAIRPT
jgi:SAM-dependent methyltransferase